MLTMKPNITASRLTKYLLPDKNNCAVFNPRLRRSKTHDVMLSVLTETAKATAIAGTPSGSVVGSQGG